MTNLNAVKSLCNAICNAFYPDDETIGMVLFNEGINATMGAQPKDKDLLKVAIILVRGFVETSHSENGISSSVDKDRIENNILYWCNQYGLEDDDVVVPMRTIEDGSQLW